MPRWVLRHRGGVAPDVDVERLACLPGVEVVDFSPRALLVAGPEDVLRAAIAELAGWAMSAEASVPVPDVRPRRGRRA